MGCKLSSFKSSNSSHCLELYNIRRQILDESSRKLLSSKQKIVCVNGMPMHSPEYSDDSLDSIQQNELGCDSVRNTININRSAGKNKAFKIYHKIHIIFDQRNRIVEKIKIIDQSFYTVKIIIGSNIIGATKDGDIWEFKNIYIPIFLVDEGKIYIEIVPSHPMDVKTVTMDYKYLEIPKRFKLMLEKKIIKSGNLYYTSDGHVY
jgi:hypothetical protein